MHDESSVDVFLKVTAKDFLVFVPELFVLLFTNQLSLLFHDGHDFHIEFGTLLHGFDDFYELLASILQIPKCMNIFCTRERRRRIMRSGL